MLFNPQKSLSHSQNPGPQWTNPEESQTQGHGLLIQTHIGCWCSGKKSEERKDVRPGRAPRISFHRESLSPCIAHLPSRSLESETQNTAAAGRTEEHTKLLSRLVDDWRVEGRVFWGASDWVGVGACRVVESGSGGRRDDEATEYWAVQIHLQMCRGVSQYYRWKSMRAEGEGMYIILLSLGLKCQVYILAYKKKSYQRYHGKLLKISQLNVYLKYS